MADAPPWAAFVIEWKGFDMSSLRSEEDVREEVLAPMLRMLVYGGRTLNSVLREHPEPLSREYRMGRIEAHRSGRSHPTLLARKGG